MRSAIFGLAIAALGAVPAAEVASILVINTGVQGAVAVVNAITQLTALGNTVTTGGTLADYSAFDQVWDLRYQTTFTPADLAAFGAYLAGGGSVFLIGEHVGFDATRNLSLQMLLEGVGAGTIAYGATPPSNTQTFTAAGAALNTPNALATLAYLGARAVTNPGNGFLVTESSPGVGSMVAWDFGDLAGAPNARLVVLWDIDVFRDTTGNGVNWTENLVTYLDGAPPAAIPEPSTWLTVACGLLVTACGARRRRKAARCPGLK